MTEEQSYQSSSFATPLDQSLPHQPQAPRFLTKLSKAWKRFFLGMFALFVVIGSINSASAIVVYKQINFRTPDGFEITNPLTSKSIGEFHFIDPNNGDLLFVSIGNYLGKNPGMLDVKTTKDKIKFTTFGFASLLFVYNFVPAIGDAQTNAQIVDRLKFRHYETYHGLKMTAVRVVEDLLKSAGNPRYAVIGLVHIAEGKDFYILSVSHDSQAALQDAITTFNSIFLNY